MRITLTREEILKLAAKFKSELGRHVESMAVESTISLMPDTDIFKDDDGEKYLIKFTANEAEKSDIEEFERLFKKLEAKIQEVE